MHECKKCKTKFELSDIELEWNKLGRQGKCPKCKRKILFVQEATGYHKQLDGSLINIRKKMLIDKPVTPEKTRV